MRNLLNPKWLFVVNTIPVALLFIIAFGQYDVIESLLSKESKLTWQNFALYLLALSVINAAYAGCCLLKKQNISIIYSIFTLVCYTAFLYFYVQKNAEIVPFSIPQWMITSDVVFYPGTFLMPTLIHALLTIVVISIPKNKKANPWLNFLYGLVFPLLSYLFVQIALPLWQLPENNYGFHVIVVIFITITILFLFFICRGVYILINSHSNLLIKNILIWKIIIGILFPILGLLVNNGVLFGRNSFTGSSPFGDFSSPIFYFLVIINGVLLCLPTSKNDFYRLIRFQGLVICFPYVLYFFLIFLPFLPLSIVAIIIIGVGFLMLAPLILFIAQTSELYTEYAFLAKKYSTKKMAIASVFSVLIIPIIITTFYLNDKVVLNYALSYVYDSNYQNDQKINKSSLAKTLNTIKQHKGRSSSNTSGEYLPFLTSYYNWLVLDNMILSDTKIATLEQIFFGEKNELYSFNITDVSTAKIKAINTSSKYDVKQKAWETILDFTLKNSDTGGFGNYETTFSLPEGCWISDYYLYVGNRKEMGILAEKKSALWIFKQIRNENRDPGILYYLTGNRVAFKVFPFNKNEIRKTGITFMHKEPFVLNIDSQKVSLGNKNTAKTTSIQITENATYIPTAEKAKLSLVRRKPEYHFIIDVSKGNSFRKTSFLQRIENYITNHKIDRKTVKINFTNSYSLLHNFNSDWKMKLAGQAFEGGYYLEGAIKQTLLASYSKASNKYPVIIAVTDSIQNAVILKDFADLQVTFPEGTSFYELDKQNKIWEHSLIENPLLRLQQIAKIPTNTAVFVWPNVEKPVVYLANNNSPSIVTNSNAPKLTEDVKKTWEAGLQLQAMWQESILNPKEREDNHLAMVKYSMQRQILSPVTSFIVVENEAQKKALKRKQDQILKGNKNLDTDEDTQSMSEPNLFILLALITAAFIIKRKRQNSSTA